MRTMSHFRLRGSYKNKWASVLAVILGVAGITAGYLYRQQRAHFGEASRLEVPAPETGVAAAQGAGTADRIEAVDGLAAKSIYADWIPKINADRFPGPAPEGMAWIPGGQFWMGAAEDHMTDAQPWHRVYVDGFWMDKNDVTNEQFEAFVKATGYVTIAERAPKADDYPQAVAEMLVPGSVVFAPPDHAVQLDNHFRWWSYVAGANWRHPEGPKSDIKGRMKHPVVHIAYDDALAYCNWAGARLPTEAEFEFASRGRLDRKRYDWGDEFMPGGKHMANTFQGHFPEQNTGDDGYTTTSPVGAFPANGYGLFDMAGNVWQWTSDWYRADYYETLAAGGEIAINPKGPADSDDPSEPGVKKRVLRGGSFLCTDQYCARYMAGGRGKGDPNTGTNHTGFRVARDVIRRAALR